MHLLGSAQRTANDEITPRNGHNNSHCAGGDWRRTVSPRASPKTPLPEPCIAARRFPRLEKQWSQHQGNCTQQFNDNVQRWTGRILERIANRIPHYCRPVGL
jgi:hypothetical protein